MTQESLYLRLYFQQPLWELAKFINYGGKRSGQVKEKCDEMSQRFGDRKVTWALHELTMEDKETGHLRPTGPPR